MSMVASTYAIPLKVFDVGGIRVRNGLGTTLSGLASGSDGWRPLEAMRLARLRWRGNVTTPAAQQTTVRGRVYKNGVTANDIIYEVSRNATISGEFMGQDEHMELITPDDFLVVTAEQSNGLTQDTQEIHITLERAG